jgi:hypothetical protein
MGKYEAIIKKHKGNRTQENMIADINTAFNGHTTLSRSNLSNWKIGTSRPDYFAMVYLALKADGWVKQFALDILRELRPDLWGNDE